MSLASGGSMQVPLALVVKYEQPQPQPSNQMIEKIKEVIARPQRRRLEEARPRAGDAGEHGPRREQRAEEARATSQPPEAQQRIDAILKELEKAKSGRQTAGATTAPGPGAGVEGDLIIDP